MILCALFYLVGMFYQAKTNQPKQFKLMIGVVIALMVLGGLVIAYMVKKNTTTKNNLVKTSELLEESDTEEDNNRPLPIIDPVASQTVQLGSGAGQEVDGNKIDYIKFTELMHTDQFQTEYFNAVQIGLKMKAKRYRTMYLDEEQKYNNMNVGKSGNQFDIYNEKAKKIKKAMDRILSILKSIRDQRTTLTKKSCADDLISGITDPAKGLASLIGREEIKDYICKRIYTFKCNPKIFLNSYQNQIFTADSGWGKTKIAQVMGWVYSKSHILITSDYIRFTAKDFTTAYVNESASLTRVSFLSSLESVMFIDEAYGLCPPQGIMSGRNHNEEAITEMLTCMEDFKGCMVINMAGYKEQMEELKASNQGLSRRIPYTIELKPHTSSQLTEILMKNIKSISPELVIENGHINYTFSIIDYLYSKDKDVFPRQAGDMENISQEICNEYYAQIDNRSLYKAIETGMNSFLAPRNIHVKAPHGGTMVLDEEN